MIQIRVSKAESLEILKRTKKKQKHKHQISSHKQTKKLKQERYKQLKQQINSLPKRKHYLQYQTYYSSPLNRPLFYEDYGFEDEMCMIKYEEFNWFLLRWMINAGNIRKKIEKRTKEDNKKAEYELWLKRSASAKKGLETRKKNLINIRMRLVNTLKLVEEKKIEEELRNNAEEIKNNSN